MVEKTKKVNSIFDNPQGVDEEYCQIVEEAAIKGENLEIPNSTLDHAVFLSQALISVASDNIKILTGELNSPYYERVENQLEAVAERFNKEGGNKEIRIVIWEKESDGHGKIRNLRNKYSDVIKVKSAEQSEENVAAHFLVSDSVRYRLEEPHTKRELEKKEVRGRANFHDVNTASILNDRFDEIWDVLEEVKEEVK